MTVSTEQLERESMEFDVVIVGAGPAGLSAAIRLKQINPDLSVVVIEKGAEVGAHILSGAVVDPIGIDRLLPGWFKEADHPFKTEVRNDQFLFLGPAGSIRLPNFIMPPLMSNHGNYIVSLGNVCRWLATKAEELGVEIYPGFAATEVLYDENGAVRGVATGDMGIGHDGEPTNAYARGMELLGKYTLIGEGVRGSLAKQLNAKFKLDAGREPQKFGLGIKELWQVKSENHKPGLVQHSFGWPLDGMTGGGSFLYHLEDNQVAVGFVMHLNYKNPWISPFEEFQRFKTHPAIRGTFQGGKRLSYGARAITEGGWQSVPKLTFPGGSLIGCSAGFVNVPRIKGSHNAVLSGMLAAEKVAAAIEAGRANDEPIEIENEWRATPIGKDLKRVRNVKPLWSKFGTFIGIGLGGLDMWINQIFGTSPFTLKHGKTDAASLEPAYAEEKALQNSAQLDRLCFDSFMTHVGGPAYPSPMRSGPKKIEYPKPDGVLTFDRLSSVYLSNTNHEEDQPIHLQVKNADLQVTSELGVFGGPSTRYCPAGVYEWVEKNGTEVFVINAQNCVHCKTCDIKDPNQNINWVPPQGGEGPVYPNM